MPELILRFPVTTLEGRQLLPAGTVLSEATLEQLAASGPTGLEPVCVLEFGDIRQDLQNFLMGPPYQTVFGGPKGIANLLASIAAVHLARPCLDCLVYFR